MLSKWLFRKKALKKVLMLNPHGYVEYPPPLGKTDTGGQIVYLLQLAKALGKKNIQVDIFTRQFDNKPREQKVFDNVRIIRIPCGPDTFIPKEKIYECIPEFVKNTLAWIKENREKYSIIHSHYWDGGYAGMKLSRALVIPHVHTPHSLGKMKELELEAEKAPVQKLRPLYRYQVRIAIEQKILHDANSIILLCETTRIQLLERYIVDFEKLHVIYPGVDTAIFSPRKNKYDEQVSMEKNAILTVCRIVPAKGLDRLIESLHILPKTIPYHLYMAGGNLDEYASDEEKQTKATLNQLIKKYKMEERVTFLGKIPHDSVLPAYYRSADIFVLGGRYEPFGLTTLEAMSCGTVPLVSSVAGSREVVVDGVNGLTIDMHDRKLLAEKIKQLLTNHKLSKMLSTNARLTVEKNYAWDKIVLRFIDYYKNLL